MEKKVATHFNNHIEALDAARQLSSTIVSCAELLVESLSAGNKVMVFGNGGSAADAQHFAAEIVGRFLLDRRALPAMALSTDTSILTAVANDFGYDQVFKRQIEAFGNPGDVAIGISTSGNSHNVAIALEEARQIGCKTVGLLGCDGGAISSLVDIDLTVAIGATPHIQEMHITIIHLLCDLVEQELFIENGQ